MRIILSLICWSVGLFSNGQCLVGNSFSNNTENGNNKLGQSFTATCSGNLEYVEFFCASSGTNVAGTLKIYQGSTVLNTPIYTQTYPAMPLNSGDSLRIYLTSPLYVANTNQLTFELDMSLDVHFAGNNPYPGGRLYYNGTNSSVYAQIDLQFNVSIQSNCSNSTSVISPISCLDYQAPSGASFTSSGTYVDTIPNAAGCDSVITINVSILEVDTSVSVNGLLLSSNEANAISYTWVDCSTGNTVGTGQSFAATNSGNYQVAISAANGCIAESLCQSVIVSGIEDPSRGNDVVLFPNPAASTLHIQGVTTSARFSIFSTQGIPVLHGELILDKAIDLSNLANGSYYMQLNGYKPIRFIVQ